MSASPLMKQVFQSENLRRNIQIALVILWVYACSVLHHNINRILLVLYHPVVMALLYKKPIKQSDDVLLVGS